MAYFDYKCKKCGKLHKDIIISENLDMLKQKCSCGSTEFEKLPPKFSVRFKGGGWTNPSRD